MSLVLQPFRAIVARILFQRAHGRYRRGDYAEAAEIYEKILEISPRHIRGRCALARSRMNLGELDAAESVLLAASGAGVAHHRIDYLLAAVLNAKGEYIRALPLAERAHSAVPEKERYATLARRLGGDLKVFVSGWRPTLERVEDYRPVPRKIMHVLEMSLPHKEAGYTFRSQYILSGQQNAGFVPFASTRAGFPADAKIEHYDEIETVAGVPYHRIELDGPRYHYSMDAYLAAYAGGVRSLAIRERPEILHAASNFKNGLVAQSVAESLGIPWVYEMRGMWEDTGVANRSFTEESDRYRLHRKMESHCLRNADAIVTLSGTMRDEICSRGVDPDAIFVVPNGVNADNFPVMQRNETLARELGIDSSPVVGYVGSFSYYEGLDLLIRAHEKVLRRCPAARLLLVGDGHESKALAAIVEQLGLGGSVLLTGRIDHGKVLDYYSLIDVFVVPRRASRVTRIVTPIKPYEAMATGRTVLVSDVEALKEMIVEGETGTTFTAGDEDALASACVELIDNRERRGKMGAEGARWVRQHRNWQTLVERYEQVYETAKRRQLSSPTRRASSR